MWACWIFPLCGWEKERIPFFLTQNSIKKSKRFRYLSPYPFWVGFCLRCSWDFSSFWMSIQLWKWNPRDSSFFRCKLEFFGVWLQIWFKVLVGFFGFELIDELEAGELIAEVLMSLDWDVVYGFGISGVLTNWVWVVLLEFEESVLVEWILFFLWWWWWWLMGSRTVKIGADDLNKTVNGMPSFVSSMPTANNSM